MTDFTVPDCLVLKLQEVEEQNSEKIIDSTVYILYDKKEHRYIVRGKRRCCSFRSNSNKIKMIIKMYFIKMKVKRILLMEMMNKLKS